MKTLVRTPLARSRPQTLRRRVRERAARHQDIVAAARDVFASRGFEKATLEEIAEHAELGKGTVYNYFESKESLFTAALESLLDDMREIASAAALESGSARQCFDRYTTRLVHYYRRNYDFCQMVSNECARVCHGGRGRRHRRLQDSMLAAVEPLAGALRQAIKTGEVRRADPMSLAIMFFGLLHEYFLHAPSVRGARVLRDTDLHTDLVVSVFFDGVGRARAASGV
ncbi:MAG: TetR/AcrR family transcriptional regulator [Candidatus Zixiibacteriota bacterium]